MLSLKICAWPHYPIPPILYSNVTYLHQFQNATHLLAHVFPIILSLLNVLKMLRFKCLKQYLLHSEIQHVVAEWINQWSDHQDNLKRHQKVIPF
jgi:hypothetical protein